MSSAQCNHVIRVLSNISVLTSCVGSQLTTLICCKFSSPCPSFDPARSTKHDSVNGER